MGLFDKFKHHANKAADKATDAIPGQLDDKLVDAAKSGVGAVGDAGQAAAGMAGSAAGAAKDAAANAGAAAAGVAGGAAGAVGGAASTVASTAADVADKASDAAAAAASKVASATPTDVDDKLVDKVHDMNPLNKKEGEGDSGQAPAEGGNQQPPAAA